MRHAKAYLTQSAEGELRQPGGLLLGRPMTLRPHLAMGLPFRDAQPIGFDLYVPPAPAAYSMQEHPLDLCNQYQALIGNLPVLMFL